MREVFSEHFTQSGIPIVPKQQGFSRVSHFSLRGQDTFFPELRTHTHTQCSHEACGIDTETLKPVDVDIPTANTSHSCKEKFIEYLITHHLIRPRYQF